ncbi:MAG: methionyl-tRNA formyltransferase [Candidatus Niyogibacteria bacterium]|nr:methionyl-tRNA formyltransferase [Candidatus Niyogibacteria bacterium]
MKPRFIFFGTPKFAVFVLDELERKNLKPLLVVTAPDKPAGRGLRAAPSPVKKRAESHGIPVFQPPTLKTAEAAERIAKEHADVFVVAAYGKMIPADILELPTHKTLNIHPSLLPRWRGADPIRAAILAGDTETGVSIMQLDEKLDHGPIVAQKSVPIGEKTYEELEGELARLGGEMIADILPRWLAGKIESREQNHDQATFTKKITKEDGHLDWNEPAEMIERKIRALNPWPGTYAFWKRGEKMLRLRILEARTVSASGKPGTVIPVNDGFAVACANGAIRIKTIQLEGKKATPSAEFARGYPDIIGTILS